jgi:hypothetical protein
MDLTMKSFKDYLVENKKTYDFKIKVAGDLPEKFESTLKSALEKYSVENMKASKTPIQKFPLDFPHLDTQEVHIYEVSLNYPVIPPVLTQYVSEATGVERARIVVRSPHDPIEEYQNVKDQKYVPKLTSEMESADPNAQEMVGDKHRLSLLSTLSKHKHNLNQYNGINDELLAKTAPSDKVQETMDTGEDIKSHSPLGNKKMPDPKGMRK